MSERVRIECTLDELHQAIAESIRQCITATRHRIVTSDNTSDEERKIRELGRNAAGALMLFAIDETEAV